jgi:hypothetical protein
MSVCVKCGKANREGINFCSNCGNPMEVVSKTSNPCARCGKENRDGVKFCVNCGGQLGLFETPRMPAPPIPNIAAPPIYETSPASAPPPLMESALPLPPASQALARSAANRKQLIMWIMAAILAVVVIVLSWYVYQNWQAGRQSASLIQPEVTVPQPQAESVPEYAVQPSNQAIQPESVEPSLTTERTQRSSGAIQRTMPSSARTQPANSPSFADSSRQSSEEATTPKYEGANDSSSQSKQEEKTPKYEAATSGIMTWSGVLKKGDTVVISGSTANRGSLNSSLPGVPVFIEVEPRDIGIAEAPAPSSGWTRMVLRSNKEIHKTITIRWKVFK